MRGFLSEFLRRSHLANNGCMKANFYAMAVELKSVWNVERISSNKRLLSTVVAAVVYMYIVVINGHVGNDVDKMT